jgi:BirA family transcriptional regulator, biotin operon repressor / biotin---[acetyl-CoA-carboxylase] ligase
LYKIPATTVFLGQNMIFMPECHSTNDRMLLLCQNESPPEGTVVITANQTAGRGQRGNSWEAAPGLNLTFTGLFKPAFLPVQKQFYLYMFTSLGVRDYLTKRINKKVQIKWPNDVLVNGKKICGVLIENQLQATRLTNCLVGIGLNINQRDFGVTSATSIALETNVDCDLSIELEAVLGNLESRYLQLRSGNEQKLMDDYLGSLYRYHEETAFFDGTSSFVGAIVGLDEIGRLKVQRSEGIFVYDIKQIRYSS